MNIFGQWWFWLIVAAAILIIYAISVYNRLISLQEKLHDTYARMGIVFGKVNNVLMDSQSIVKGATAHEKSIWDKFENARSAIAKASSSVKSGDSVKIGATFGDALMGMRTITENYPEMQANQNFTMMQSEIRSLYDEGQGSQLYNNAYIVKFNNLVRRFPSMIFAKLFGFKPITGTDQSEFFDNDKSGELKSGRPAGKVNFE
ncbi:MAG: LemA family protein [Candidatus Nomurabacteria bacterium]|jgi:LemA protein|nr:LemA family protein [Candidatus Nomurabacteria bacterium]